MANRDYVIPQGDVDGEVTYFQPIAVMQEHVVQILKIEVINPTKSIELTGISGRRTIRPSEAQELVEALQSAIEYIEEL